MSRKRNPNFTSQEIQILTDEVEKNKFLLFSRLTNTATNSAKKRAWEAVCSKMKAVNDTDHFRTVEVIRKKWTCYISSTKKKLTENEIESRRTGGGPSRNKVSSVEEKVAGIIGKTPINGIDTFVSSSFEKQDSFASVPSPEKSKRLSSSSSSILQAFPLISSHDDYAVEDVNITQDMPSSSKVAKLDIPTKKFLKETDTLRLIEIENERLKVERERLQIERSRYEVDKDRYNLNVQKLEIEKEKLEMEKGRYNLELSRQ
ncbi:myb/SANT-like DNA-binding domain-containing protein 4 [Mytilus trossulus]|uniref:myb/SANT-like DNA-binding domain-containing protein 4 n=1 Tax=Mytilus trossulus TaxID=6551 RepID=UPI003006C044